MIVVVNQDYDKRRTWTSVEEEILKRYYQAPFYMKVGNIAKVLGRSERAVIKKLGRGRILRDKKNVGLKQWLAEGGTLRIPDELKDYTRITQVDIEDAARLEARLREEGSQA